MGLRSCASFALFSRGARPGHQGSPMHFLHRARGAMPGDQGSPLHFWQRARGAMPGDQGSPMHVCTGPGGGGVGALVLWGPFPPSFRAPWLVRSGPAVQPTAALVFFPATRHGALEAGSGPGFVRWVRRGGGLDSNALCASTWRPPAFGRFVGDRYLAVLEVFGRRWLRYSVTGQPRHLRLAASLAVWVGT